MARTAELLLPIGRALYLRDRWPDASSLARHLGTSPGALAPWIQFLGFHRVLRETPEGLVADTDRLLSVLTASRIANLRPEAPAPTGFDATAVHDRLDDAGIRHVFAMFSAANAWAFFEPRRDLHLYVARASLPHLRRALGTRRARGMTGGVLQVYAETLERLEVQSRAGLPVTSPFQTVLDLRAHPEGGAHAAFLQEKLLPRLREARS